jgi:amino acid permease
MKKATFYGIGATTIFYLSLGCAGYAAFGNNAPGNILTGFGFYEPFWLVDIGNLCIILHLFGAYQVNFNYLQKYKFWKRISP